MKNIEDKTPSITNLVTNAALDAKINKVKREIPSITNLVTIAALTVLENKIRNVREFVKKSDDDVEVKDTKNKYFTASDYNKFTNNILDAKITAKKVSLSIWF